MPQLPQLPQIILILILIVVLGWGIGVLILMRAHHNYVEKSDALIDQLYNELLKNAKQNEWLQQELMVGEPTLPEMDIDQIL